MKKFLKITIFTMITGLILLPASAQATGQRATVLANSCAGCHGTDGKSTGSIPSIHGMQKDYFTKSMQEFRDGTRKGTVMGRIAKGYSDEDIALMAGHFSALK